MIHHVTPINVLPLFPVLDEKLISLLRSLNDEDWRQLTLSTNWTVKDVAAHLLNGNLRTLSLVRDNYFEERRGDIETFQNLVSYLDTLNAEWIVAAKRLSPRVIIDLLEATGKEYWEVLKSLDPWEDAAFSAAWAGEEISKNWFHIAREYTEKWIYQQQIRTVLNMPGILTRELFNPFLETFMCALPQTYKYTDAVVGSSVMVRVTGEVGGEWHINKTEEGWVLRHTTRVAPLAVVELDADTTWKLFSKIISPEEALEKVKITGAEELGKVALGIVAVVV
ncbi:MAG TPA: maleylpyruvate isomerase N-terminal domain-containing protein [Flavipsychrobacter sp.]|nr:maleylpyruvate isomerase N-terminal domain-containing protein [Flavipsychrobacter sp.]